MRTTTVRNRPTSRKPPRRPVRRPVRRRTTTTTSTEAPISEISAPSEDETSNFIENVQSKPQEIVNSTPGQQILEPVVILTQRPTSTVMQATTPKAQTVTNIEDPGLQMSLAHITGQLSEMPVTTIISTTKITPALKNVEYEKIETMTPRNPSTVAFSTTSQDRGDIEPQINDDMVQIVQTLESQSSEHVPVSVETEINEGRFVNDAPSLVQTAVENDYYEGLSLSKKKHKKNRNNDDYEDVLGLTSIGESIIHSYRSLGLDGKRKHKEKNGDGRKNKDKDNDDILGIAAWSDTLGFGNGKNKNRGEGRRRNKMMRGDWD